MDQKQVLQMLENGRFPDNDQGQKIIETNIAWVIIGKKYAYKIKKPVHLSFLDFSTSARRKFYCNEEVRLNRRLTQGIYLNVLPVIKEGDTYRADGAKGRAIEYLVQMKKLNHSLQMDVLLQKNKVTREHIRNLAKEVYDFHRRAEVIHLPFNRQNADHEFNDIGTVKEFLGKNAGSDTARSIDIAIRQSGRFLRKNEKLLARRVKEGFVRDGHGDMHSGNIFLYKKPVIFDCIEFSEVYRHIDVLYEVAFLCMDLEAFDQPHLSSYFLGLYEKEKLSDELYTLFTYYKARLANVRAKVNALNAMQMQGKEDTVPAVQESLKYVRLMSSYMQLLQ